MLHLTVRVAWHDARWNGTVCCAPSSNASCAALERIRDTRDDAREDALAGRAWSSLGPEELPACQGESGAFMSPRAWSRRFVHPYARSPSTAATHGHLRPTVIAVPPYATFAVPYGWMRRDAQAAIDEALPTPLPPDEVAPFDQAWVFGRARQQALLDHFFGQLAPDRSLVFFYCKDGHPLGEGVSRVVVGIGRLTAAPGAAQFERVGAAPSYRIWDHLIQHSVRPDGEDGFLLPYHDYLAPTGDPGEDARRLALLREILVEVDPGHAPAFSDVSEHATAEVAVATLVRALAAVRKIREHGIAPGPWARREEWLSAQLAAAWRDRGAFPGLGSALDALGLRLGSALAHQLIADGLVAAGADPWPIVDRILRGAQPVPRRAYEADVRAIRALWGNLPDERRAVLALLSRFALTPAQATRWFDEAKRRAGTLHPVSDAELRANPYRLCEVDAGDGETPPISLGTVDRGALPEDTIAARHPLPGASAVESPNDPRRLRAALVTVLRHAAAGGDALLGEAEALAAVEALALARPCRISADWVAAHAVGLAGVVERLALPAAEAGAPRAALQLTEYRAREEALANILLKRAAHPLPPVPADWRALLVAAITDGGEAVKPQDPRHVTVRSQALSEQERALRQLTARRLTVLVGNAGTGKTSVTGALARCPALAADGLLFLAPTGKATVRLGAATGAAAMTVAQFLHKYERYDGERQRVRFTGKAKHRQERTVVVDECSMLTLDELAAVLDALDLAHVQRVILVGDPNQLPPIGVGRPFSDLVDLLAATSDTARDGGPLGDALARLTVEVRTRTGGARSDALRLASWFTRERPPVDADAVLSELELGGAFNDLTIHHWTTAEELHRGLGDALAARLGVDPSVPASFNASLGLDEQGMSDFARPDGAARWQILSPVRAHAHGVVELNRWVQRRFRQRELAAASEHRAVSLGDERIVARDKVIHLRNERRPCFRWPSREVDKQYLANGEVGVVAPVRGHLKVLFAGRPNVTFDYWPAQFRAGHRPLELAYALTVHKAQGSQFQTVFVVVPRQCATLSRELLYTALTRARDHLVLLVEGRDASALLDLTRPERSETARRNTNLFGSVVRTSGDALPPAAGQPLRG